MEYKVRIAKWTVRKSGSFDMIAAGDANKIFEGEFFLFGLFYFFIFLSGLLYKRIYIHISLRLPA